MHVGRQLTVTDHSTTRPTDGKIKGAAPGAPEAIAAQSLFGRRSGGHGGVSARKRKQINARDSATMTNSSNDLG